MTLYTARRGPVRLRPLVGDGIVLLVLAFVVSPTCRCATRAERWSDDPPRSARSASGDVLSHGYIWLCLLIFVTPFLVLLGYSFSAQAARTTVDNFQYVFGSFLENLKWSLLVSGLTLVGNVLIALPAAYALMRYPVPGKRLLFTAVTLPLYVPGAVIGLSLLLTYYFTYHLTTSVFGLIFAMMIGHVPADADARSSSR